MSKNVFQDLGFDEEEAAGLKLKSYLFMALQEIIRSNSMTQKEVAEIISADQTKISKILAGKFSEFSIERITEYLQKLGYDIHIDAVPCPKERTLGTVVVQPAKTFVERRGGHPVQTLSGRSDASQRNVRKKIMSEGFAAKSAARKRAK